MAAADVGRRLVRGDGGGAGGGGRRVICGRGRVLGLLLAAGGVGIEEGLTGLGLSCPEWRTGGAGSGGGGSRRGGRRIVVCERALRGVLRGEIEVVVGRWGVARCGLRVGRGRVGDARRVERRRVLARVRVRVPVVVDVSVRVRRRLRQRRIALDVVLHVVVLPSAARCRRQCCCAERRRARQVRVRRRREVRQRGRLATVVAAVDEMVRAAAGGRRGERGRLGVEALVLLGRCVGIEVGRGCLLGCVRRLCRRGEVVVLVPAYRLRLPPRQIKLVVPAHVRQFGFRHQFLPLRAIPLPLSSCLGAPMA